MVFIIYLFFGITFTILEMYGINFYFY